jgi:hypothetical protein
MDPDRIRQAAEDFTAGLRAFGRIVTGAVVALQSMATAAVPALLWAAGYQAGEQGEPRDWTMPDDWHRGYLRGKRALLARRMKHHASATP